MAPVAVDDSATTPVNTPVTVSVLTNDTAGTGTLTVTSTSTPAHGTVVINAGGTVTYTPASGYAGTDSFTYTITNTAGLTATATVNITVTAVAPTAVNDTATTPMNTPVTVSVLTNDTAGTGTLTVTTTSTPAHGTVVINGDGTVTYTPTSGYAGPDSFTYTIKNAANLTATATVNITVTVVAPTAVNDTATTPVNTPVTVSVLTNDTAGTGTLAVTATSTPAHGTVVINGDGTVTYTPASGYVGPDSFTYTVKNSANLTTTGTVSITVTAVAPTAVNDTATTPANTPVTVTVLTNDTNPGGGALTVTTTSTPAHGTVVINGDGTVKYTPASGYVGTDSFTYTIKNSANLTATATVNITVTGAPPAAVNDSGTTPAGTPVSVTVLSNDSNPGGGTLTVTSTTTPAHGTVVINPNGTVTYTPTGTYTGSDSFVYTITNSLGLTTTATVNITVTPALPKLIVTGCVVLKMLPSDAGYTSNVWMFGPTTRDLGVNNRATGAVVYLGTYATATEIIIGIKVVDTGDTFKMGAGSVNPDGLVHYALTPGVGGAVNVGFEDINGGGDLDFNDVVVLVQQCGPVAAIDDTATTPVNTPVQVSVLPNDSTTNGGTLTVTVAGPAAHGTVVINPDGTVTYTPTTGYVGPDSFSYTIKDVTGTTATAHVDVTVQATVPTATDDAVTTDVNQPVNISVLANDSDPGTSPLTVTVAGPAAHGTVVINPDGTVTYTPATGYVGTDVFNYTMRNSSGLTDSAQVTVTINAVAPVAVNDSASTNANQAVTITVLTNDSDPGGSTLTVVSATGGAHGGTVVNANGTIKYTPAPGYAGNDSFTYTIKNVAGLTATATVSVVVRPLPPVAVNDAATTTNGHAVTIPVLANDDDPMDGTLTVSAVGTAAHGTVVINSDGTVKYTPTAGYIGTDTFQYTLTSTTGLTSTATVTVTVNPVGPLAVNDSASTNAGTAVNIAVRSNDSDPNGGTLTVTAVGTAAHGTVSINGDGTVKYTPTAGYTGTDTFQYTIKNSANITATASVTVTVNAVVERILMSGCTVLTVLAGSADYTSDIWLFAPGSARALGLSSQNVGSAIYLGNYSSNTEVIVGIKVRETDKTFKNGLPSVNLDNLVHARLTFLSGGAVKVSFEDIYGGGDLDYNDVIVQVQPCGNPEAVNDTATANGVATNISVLANDSTPNGGTLTVTTASGASHGTTSINSDGTVKYTPASGYNGTDSFSYTIRDAAGKTDTATVTVTVRGRVYGKSMGYWGNSNGDSYISSHGNYSGNSIVIGTSSGRRAEVNTRDEAQKVLPGDPNACGKGNPQIFGTSSSNCTRSSGLNESTLNTLAAQTLALSYNIRLITGYTGPTLSGLGCSVPSGLSGVTTSSTVNSVLTLANSFIGGSASGGSTTQAQAGAMNTLLGCLNSES